VKTIYAGGIKWTHDGKHWTAHNRQMKRKTRIVNDAFAESLIRNARENDRKSK